MHDKHSHPHDQESGNHAHSTHSHEHTNSASAPRLMTAGILTLIFVAAEGIAGWYAHSLALWSDAGHNFSDAAALGISWLAIIVSKKPATPARSYGWHRMNILAALVNSLSLAGIGAVILWEAVQRLITPEPVHSGIMIVIALMALVLNLTIAGGLHDHGDDLNIRSAYLHMLGDAAAAAGVLVAGIIVNLTGFSRIDPIVSLLIGGMIAWSSWGILKEALNILLEGAPTGLDMNAVAEGIRHSPGVIDLHDLHVWTISSGMVACSCHIMIAEQAASRGQQILAGVSQTLSRNFGISHSTIQIEVIGCEIDGFHCHSSEDSRCGMSHTIP